MEEAEPKAHSVSGSRFARFGAFELRFDTGELRKYGIRVRLQGKSFQILRALLEKPGQIVTREELRARLWPADTFVDFESGLNSAVNRLRMALGDSAEQPMFIDTLPRIGYRFIASVELSSAHETKSRQPENKEIGAESNELPLPSEHSRSGLYRKLALLGLAGAALAMAVLWAIQAPSRPVFQQLTFHRGFVSNARFAPGENMVVYSAIWNGGASGVFLSRIGSPLASEKKVADGRLAGIASAYEIGLFAHSNVSAEAQLQRLPLSGGSARPVHVDGRQVDWGPNGTLAVVKNQNAASIVQFPVGKAIYRSAGWIDNMRVAPRGERIAFAEHPVINDDGGRVVVLDLASCKSRIVSDGWASLDGLAWRTSGTEVWFTAARSGVERVLMAADLRGAVRQVAQLPGGMRVWDISRSGKVLIDRGAERMNMFLGSLKDGSEQDVSWLDWSHAEGLSSDGKVLLFDESGAGGGRNYKVLVYWADSHSVTSIGEGRALSLSDNGRWALTQNAAQPDKVALVSTDGHTSKSIQPDGFAYYWIKLFPDGKQILFDGNLPNQKRAIYRREIPDGKPFVVNTEIRLSDPVLDAGGRYAAGLDDSATLQLLNLSDGTTRAIGSRKHLKPIVITNRGEILTRGEGNVLYLINIASGESMRFGALPSNNGPNAGESISPLVARNLDTFAYSRLQRLSDLFVVSGWK